MLDAYVRKLISPPLDAVASRLASLGVSANVVTASGFAIGLLSIPAIGTGHYLIGLAAILINRGFDLLDGALARRRTATDLGAYLDITLDFIFYASVPFAFALADPPSALASCFLVLSFVGTGTTFLAFAILAEKREISADARGPKSFFHLGGLTEGTETVIAFALACLLPNWFGPIAYVFGFLCFVTTGSRIAYAVKALRD